MGGGAGAQTPQAAAGELTGAVFRLTFNPLPGTATVELVPR